MRVKGESCSAADAGGQPPRRCAIHRMRKPSRSGTHSRRPGAWNRRRDSPLLRPGSLLQRAAPRSALCRPPARPCPLFNPAWWFRPPPTIQRRNHDPRPPPCSPPKHHLARPKRQQSRKQCSSLHGVAWAANPASSPAPPPTQVVDTTAHHVPLKLAQLAPPTLLTGPCIY